MPPVRTKRGYEEKYFSVFVIDYFQVSKQAQIFGWFLNFQNYFVEKKQYTTFFKSNNLCKSTIILVRQ